ncbi:MAG: hypothetical protein IM488_18250 [Microcystis sp. M025S2]|uniref:hypothetical protein n=1 Tax=Microcystis sp. M025S2 TaxID=2771161 RepID=UPI00258EA027|nr:hypothetical protein [Microcystis sp. M025S2]MCA2711270.1 hypothetical protein [Microcystis sp. M025S2]
MSITGTNINKEIINLKKDISDIRSSLAENGVLIAQLSSIVNSVPDMGSSTYKMTCTEPSPGTKLYSVFLERRNGVGARTYSPSYDGVEKKFYFYYLIPDDKDKESYSADKLFITPVMNRSNALNPKLLAFTTIYVEDLHIDLRISKEDNTKCRVDFKFKLTDSTMDFLVDFMVSVGAICEIDMFITDYN